MVGNVTIYEIKHLKGPDRLLRMGIIIEDALNIKDSIEMLGDVANALIFKYHKLLIDFPVNELIAALPCDDTLGYRKLGEILNGKLGIDILFMRKSNSVFKIRYYTELLEFERKFSNVLRYSRSNGLNINSYEFKHYNGELRDGYDVPSFNIQINYND